MAKKQSTLSINKLLTEAWSIFKDKWQFVIGLGVLIFLIQWVISYIEGSFGDNMVMSLIAGIISWVISVVIQMGFLKIYIKLASRKEAKIPDMWDFEPMHVLNYVWGTFLYGIVVVLGLILLIIPGIYLALKYMFVPYILVTKPGVKALEAMEMSAKMTMGEKWTLLGLWAVVLVVNILGALLLGLGLIITIPVTYLAYAIAYNQLTAKA